MPVTGGGKLNLARRLPMNFKKSSKRSSRANRRSGRR